MQTMTKQEDANLIKNEFKTSYGNTPRRLEEYYTNSPTTTIPELQPWQVIFPTAFEHEFYRTIVGANHDIRICCIKKVWVDTRALALSMSPGGWINPSVMDFFGMLTTTYQLKWRKDGHWNKNDILTHIVIKNYWWILRWTVMIQTTRCFFGTNNVGFRLEAAGLVHIPCPFDKQWILIVTNFYDKTFDVLNPDFSFDKVSSLVRTVIFNFKGLFALNYPGCQYFNIHDFQVRHVKVPKHNFRYDSGIFVIQYIRWYNGLEVHPFSNAVVQGIRESISCQLVINNHNELQIPLVRQFLAKNAPHLVHWV